MGIDIEFYIVLMSCFDNNAARRFEVKSEVSYSFVIYDITERKRKEVD